MRVIKNPVVQFLAAGVLALGVIVFGTGELSDQAAAQEAIDESITTTQVLAHSVAEPAIPRGLVDLRPGAIDRFHRVVQRLLVDDVERIKIWSADGTVLYSDATELIGSQYQLGQDELKVLRSGGDPEAEVLEDPNREENIFEDDSRGLVEVYTRIKSPEGEPLLFEAYFSAAEIADRREAIFASFRPITLGALGLLVVTTTPLVWALTRRLTRSAKDRARLFRAAVDASDSERRRIARDLHDGVVQDLAGTSFALSAHARAAQDNPELATALDDMSGSVRRSLRSLRSLLVEIYPPDLQTHGLAAALDDLVAPAAGAGVSATVDVQGVDDMSPDVVALVWRVAQEAVRNAVRHGRPAHLKVLVRGDDARVSLEVSDDGSGFDPVQARQRGERFGLRGLHDLIREAGGSLDVRSAPGAGTTVRLEVAR